MGFCYVLTRTDFKNQPPVTKEVRDTLRIRDTVRYQESGSYPEVDVDFKLLNALAIERVMQDNQIVTLISYKDKNNDLRQFYFLCSEEQHKRLVKKFKKQISN